MVHNKMVFQNRAKLVRKLSSGTDVVDLENFSGIRSNKHKSGLPGKAQGERRMRESEYSELMKSKQTVRFYYRVKEGQFKRMYDKAAQSRGSTGDNLLTALELRLDNIVYRAGFAATRAQARQMVSHGHVMVDGACVDIPSFACKQNQTISIIQKSHKLKIIEFAAELAKQKESVRWLDLDHAKMSAKISEMPELDKLNEVFKINHIVELYSK